MKVGTSATKAGGATSSSALRAVSRAPEWGLLAGIAAVSALIYVAQPSHQFFRYDVGRDVLHNIAMFGVLAVGAAIVIIAGGIDLSVGSLVAFSGVIAANLMTKWLPGAHVSSKGPIPDSTIAAAIVITLAVGLLVGVGHAFLINVFRLPPFIATLATLSGLRSLATVISNNQSVNVGFDSFRFIAVDNRWTVGIFLVVALLGSVMLGATVLGRHFYALGGNESAARLSGLPNARLKMIAYGLSGMLSALGGLLFTADDGQASGRMGMAFELFAITAAVVGGCSLSGGVGTVRGTLLGLVLIQIVIKGTGLTVEGIDPTQIQGLVLGTIIVLAVGFNQRFRARG